MKTSREEFEIGFGRQLATTCTIDDQFKHNFGGRAAQRVGAQNFGCFSRTLLADHSSPQMVSHYCFCPGVGGHGHLFLPTAERLHLGHSDSGGFAESSRNLREVDG